MSQTNSSQTPGKQASIYNINIQNSTGAVVGDHAQVKQTFDISSSMFSEAFAQKMERRLIAIEQSMQIGFETIKGGIDDLKQGLSILYRHISQLHQEQLDKILDLVNSGLVEQGEMNCTLDAIRRALRLAQIEEVQFHTEIRNTMVGLQSVVESKLSLQQKLELTLPIIPLFLDYKVELAAGSALDLQKVLNELTQRWQMLLGQAR